MKTLTHPRARRAGQVLIILAATLFFGGAALVSGAYLTGLDTAAMDKAVVQVVEDGGRAKAARATIKSWGKYGKDFAKRAEKRNKKLQALMRDHGAERAAIETLLAEQVADLDAAVPRVLDYRFALRTQLTEAEWSAIFVRDE